MHPTTRFPRSHYQAAGWQEKELMPQVSSIHGPFPLNLLYALELHQLCPCHSFKRECFPEIHVPRERTCGFWVSKSCPRHSSWFLRYFRFCLNLQTSIQGLNISRVYLYNLGLNYLRERLSLPHLSMEAARHVCFVFSPRKNKVK